MGVSEVESENKCQNSPKFQTTKQVIRDYVRQFNNTLPSVLNQ